MHLASSQGDRASAMVHLASYIFLLRVPSESLPIAMGSSGGELGESAMIFMKKDTIYLRLAKRKEQREWFLDCEKVLVLQLQADMPNSCFGTFRRKLQSR